MDEVFQCANEGIPPPTAGDQMSLSLSLVAFAALVSTISQGQPEGRTRPPPEPPASVLQARRQRPAPIPVPASYWSRRLSPGADTVIDGIIHSRMPRAGASRFLVAGVPMSHQPRFSMAGMWDSTASPDAVAALNSRFLDFVVDAFGRDLPPPAREDMRQLYRRVSADSRAARNEFKRVAGPSAAQVAAFRQQFATIATRALIAERELFLRYPRAMPARYGAGASRIRNVPAEPTRLIQAFAEYFSGNWMKQPPQQRPKPLRASEAPLSTGIIPGLTAVRAAPGPIDCVPGIDSVSEYQAASEWVPHDDMYESRVYLASHPALGPMNDLLDDLGLETTNLYHQSVVGAIAQLEGRRVRVVTRYRLRNCPGQELKPDMQSLAARLKPDTTLNTYYRWRVISWEYANGASGTWDAADDLDLVRRAEFTSWTAAMQDLYRTVAGPDGHHPRLYAASYSVGDYGIDWVCQQVANAFGVMRYNNVLNPSPLWWMTLGLYGFQGINPRWDNFPMTHYGCVPGNICIFTSPPYAIGFAEMVAVGWGNNLDVYYNVEHNVWRETDAKYNFHGANFGEATDFAFTVPGWVF